MQLKPGDTCSNRAAAARIRLLGFEKQTGQGLSVIHGDDEWTNNNERVFVWGASDVDSELFIC